MNVHPGVLTLLDWGVLFLYVLALSAIAYSASRKVKAQDDYFLAGRSMGRWPIALSMYVAIFSTNTFVGQTGWLSRPNGTVWIGLTTIGIILAIPAVIALYPEIFLNLKITTAYEYLERRFDYPTRALGALLFLSMRIVWMSTMIYAASLLVTRLLAGQGQAATQHGPAEAILILGAIGTTFALAGGIRSVIWTDVMQFFVLFGGVLIMYWLAIHDSGGLRGTADLVFQSGKLHPPHFFSWTEDLTFVSALSFGFFGYLSNAGADQVLLQTYFTAPSAGEAKSSLRRNGYLLKPLSLLFPFLGLLFYVYYSGHPTVGSMLHVPDDALPVFVTYMLPSGIRGAVIAAILAAVLSGLSAGLTAITTCVQVDFVRRWKKAPISERSAVLLARCLVVICGIFVSVTALGVRRVGGANNILQILNIFMYPFAGVLLGIFLLGLTTRRANPRGVAIGVVCGFICTVGPLFLNQLLQSSIEARAFAPAFIQVHIQAMSGISNFFYASISTLSTSVFGYAASFLFRAPGSEKLNGLVHPVADRLKL